MAAALLVRVGRYLIRYGQNSSITLDSFETTVTGLGGHAARSHKCIDSVLVGAQLIHGLAVDRFAQHRSAGIGRDFVSNGGSHGYKRWEIRQLLSSQHRQAG
jgi:metal-dependent amidase/aminoacylase/carboxypeptidase family protein